MLKLPLRMTRSGVLFAVGLLGVFHETVINEVDRPTLLLLFAAMIGLPAFIRQDQGNDPGAGPEAGP